MTLRHIGKYGFTRVVCMMSLLFFALAVRAQDTVVVRHTITTDTVSVRVLFPQGETALYYDYSGNGEALDRFVGKYNGICGQAPISISASVSPEGTDGKNELVADLRAEALVKALKERLSIPDSLIKVTFKGVGRYELKDRKIVYPGLRYAEAVAQFPVETFDTLRIPAKALPQPVIQPEPQPEVLPSPQSVEQSPVQGPVAINAASPETPVQKSPKKYVTKPIVALKTNLLFDLLTAVNAEIEIPIGKHISLAGEWIFPDWVDRKTNRYCLQANIKKVEAKGWFRKRGNDDVLTGWSAGLYGQWGNFDFQPFTQTGWRVYKGWAAGISAGYAHKINKKGNLRLEYGLGLAYAWADYCKYERNIADNELITREDWHFNTVLFPVVTQAKVSLVWLISGKFIDRKGAR